MKAICPFCKKEFHKSGLGPHIHGCDQTAGLDKETVYFLFLRASFPEVSEEGTLKRLYIEELKSLPDIQKQYGISFRAITFLLKRFNLKQRGIKESSEKISQSKYKQTCLTKYGATNAMCSGTGPYKKREKTIKEKFGVSNVFKLSEMQAYAKSDAPYLKRYGCTGNVIRSERSRKVWENKTDEEKNLWLLKSIRSEKAIENRVKKGYMSSELETRLQLILDKNHLSYCKQFTIKSSIRSRRHYDFLLSGTKLIIEVNGDYWHANPQTYKESDLINYAWGKVLASDVWEKDKRKKELAISRGYIVIYLWEKEMKGKTDEEVFNLLQKKVGEENENRKIEISKKNQ